MLWRRILMQHNYIFIVFVNKLREKIVLEVESIEYVKWNQAMAGCCIYFSIRHPLWHMFVEGNSEPQVIISSVPIYYKVKLHQVWSVSKGNCLGHNFCEGLLIISLRPWVISCIGSKK